MAHGYTNVEARHRLQSTAEDIGLSSNEQGYGLVDVAAALGHYSGDN
jgi:subtilisin